MNSLKSKFYVWNVAAEGKEKEKNYLYSWKKYFWWMHTKAVICSPQEGEQTSANLIKKLNFNVFMA